MKGQMSEAVLWQPKFPRYRSRSDTTHCKKARSQKKRADSDTETSGNISIRSSFIELYLLNQYF